MAKVSKDYLIQVLLARRVRVPSNMSYFFKEIFDGDDNVKDWQKFGKFIRMLVDTAPACFSSIVSNTIGGILEELHAVDGDLDVAAIAAEISKSTDLLSASPRIAHLDANWGK